MRFIVNILITAGVALGLSYLLPGVHVPDYLTAIMVALALALLNGVVKPILIIFTLPATIFTLGLFLLVINSFIIYLASKIVRGFEVDGFWWALLFSILLTLITSPLMLKAPKEEE